MTRQFPKSISNSQDNEKTYNSAKHKVESSACQGAYGTIMCRPHRHHSFPSTYRCFKLCLLSSTLTMSLHLSAKRCTTGSQEWVSSHHLNLYIKLKVPRKGQPYPHIYYRSPWFYGFLILQITGNVDKKKWGNTHQSSWRWGGGLSRAMEIPAHIWPGVFPHQLHQVFKIFTPFHHIYS